MGGVWVVGRHGWRVVGVVDGGVLVRIKAVVISGIGAWWRGTRVDGHIIVDVHGKIW